MAYADLNTIHNPATGTAAPASWGDQVRDNLEFLIDPPSCAVYNSAVQSVSNNTLTTMTADSELYDNDSMHSTVTNTARITAQTAGRYLFSATVEHAGSASPAGYRQGNFTVNGTTHEFGMIVPAVASASIQTTLSWTRSLLLSASDYVEVTVRQTNGAALDVWLLEFSATYLTR